MDAGRELTTAQYCVYIGAAAGRFATTANDNVGIGLEAGRGASSGNGPTGSHNVYVGSGAAEDVTGATNCTAVGMAALRELQTANNSMGLGHDAGRDASPSGRINDDSNIICLGDNNITALYCADTSISSSDSRDKTDVTDFTHGLSWVNSLRPVTYKWDKRTWYGSGVEGAADEFYGTPDGSKKKSSVNIGFLAQEMQAVEQTHGYGNSNDDSLIVYNNCDETSLGIKYERLVPVLVNAIKELSEKNTALETRLNNAGIAT